MCLGQYLGGYSPWRLGVEARQGFQGGEKHFVTLPVTAGGKIQPKPGYGSAPKTDHMPERLFAPAVSADLIKQAKSLKTYPSLFIFPIIILIQFYSLKSRF